MSDTSYADADTKSGDSEAVSARKPSAERKSSATWLSEIEKAQNDARTYNERCDKIRDLYRYQKSTEKTTARRFALLWSNTETLKPVVYAKPPIGVVQSRFRDGDPVVRMASTMLERAINFNFDLSDYDHVFRQVRDDFLLYARGVPRLVYRAEYEEVPDADDDLAANPARPEDDERAELPEDAQSGNTAGADPYGDDPLEASQQPIQTGEVLKFEHVDIVYVDRQDFIHPKARRYEELPWIAYRAYLTRSELIEKFGEEIGQAVSLDARSASIDGSERTESSASSVYDKATIFEIWDKASGTVCWAAKGYDYVLDECPPYLRLTGFFPSPRPAFGTMTTDTLEPVPEYVFYQDQAEEINQLTARIASLIDSLKLVGFYPAGPQGEGFPEIEKAVRPGVENVMIAVKSFAAFAEGARGGVPIVWLPVEMVATIIKECVELRKQLVDDVYQITGISDIQRGATDPNETMGAQSLKAQFGSIRIRDRQAELARLCRDVARMMGEIISEHFHVETLMTLSNIKLPSEQDIQQAQMQDIIAHQKWELQARIATQQGQQPPVEPQPQPIPGPTQEQLMGLLRDGMTRRFRVDIEVDSTIVGDESRERADRTQFIEATTQFIQAWGPIIQANPLMAPLAGQLLLFGSRAFLVGRELDEVIEETIERIEKQAANPTPPQPSPGDVLKTKAEMAKSQAVIQTSQIKAQAEATKAQLGVQQAAIDHHAAVAAHHMTIDQMREQQAHQVQQMAQQHAQQMQQAQQAAAIQASQQAAQPPQPPSQG